VRIFTVIAIAGVLAGCTPTESEAFRSSKATKVQGTVTARHSGKSPNLTISRDGSGEIVKVFVRFSTYGACRVRDHYPECAP
jgi:hypothetical protein